MSNLRKILCLLLFVTVASPLTAHSQDLIDGLSYNLTIYEDDEPVDAKKYDKVYISTRISKLLSTATADTSEPWYKFEREKHGKTLEDQWNAIKDGSYFLMTYDVEKRGELPEADLFIPEEIAVGIHDTAEEGFFGDVMAYNSKTGEYKAYQVEQKHLVSLYCFEKTIPYLPEHYNALVEKYNTSDYMNSKISCNVYIDAYLDDIEQKKLEKKLKWQRIMREKHGMESLPEAQ